MNVQTARSDLDTRVDAMLQRVNRDREQRCEQVRAAADSQAREIIRAARAEARATVRAAVSQERSRFAQGLLRARAVAELEERRRAQSEVKKLLESMWTQIADALEARWRDLAHRRVWVEAALHQAVALLGALPRWRVEHGTDWSPEQRNELEKTVGKRDTLAIEWVHDTEIKGGLRIRADGVCLDATAQGLLANRNDIESAFLAEYLACTGKEPFAHE
jgi:hypothetical protein